MTSQGQLSEHRPRNEVGAERSDNRFRVVGGGAPLPGWDDLLAPEDFYQCSSWLQVMDTVGGNDINRILVGSAPAAGLVTVVATEDSPWLLARPDTLLRDSAAAELPGAVEVQADVGDRQLLPSLVCGGRHLGRTRPVGDVAYVGELVSAAEQLAADKGLRSICWPQVDERDAELVAALREAGYAEHESATYCWLPVPPGGVEEYLVGVSKHRRRRVRLARRHLAEAGVELGVQVLREAPLERLGELEAALLVKYGNPATPESSTKLLRLIAEELGENALVSYAKLDGEVIGFGLVLRSDRLSEHRARNEGGAERSGGQWFGHRAGFDYEKQGDLPLYEEVLYYRVMDEAAELGVQVLHAGIGSAEVKLSMHCESSLEYSFLKVLTP